MQMTKQTEPVQDFIQSRKKIMDYFHCEGDFYIKPLLGLEWLVRKADDFHFLTYWVSSGKKMDAVVVTKGGQPLVYKAKDYTMVVAIDCVKIAFIFQNKCRRHP